MSKDDKKEYNFVKDEVIYIHGDFDHSILRNVIPDFKKLISQQEKLRNGKIIIDIHSNGGYINVLADLLALVEQAKSKDIKVYTRSMAAAHSCGAVLLMSGTKGCRSVGPFSRVLVHHATQYTRSSTDLQLQREVEQATHLNKILRQAILSYTNLTQRKMDEMFNDDSYYVYGEDLVDFGIADTFEYTLG